jgi:hypothetical protein
MNDSQLLDERIRRFASTVDDSDWAEVARRAGLDQQQATPAPARRHARQLPFVPRRRWLVVAVAAGLLIATGAAIAAVAGVPWWQSGTPPVDPQAVASVARDNLPANVDTSRARTVAQAGFAALVAVPLNQSGYCLIPALEGRGDSGAQCEYQVANPASGDDDRLESYAQPAGRPGGPAWIVYGRITDPRAAVIDLGALTVSLQPGGFFLATVPPHDWSALNGHANSGRILDSSGTTLRSGCVNWGPSPDNTDAGLTDTILWNNGAGTCKPQLPPSPPTIDYSRAEKLFEVTLTAAFSLWKTGTTITISQAPGSNGEQCLVISGPNALPRGRFAIGPLGGDECRAPSGPWPSPGQHIEPTLGAQLVHIDGKPAYVWEADGRIDPTSGITRLELNSPSGTTPVAFGAGVFFVQLPGASSSADTLPAGGPFTLVAYDSTGNRIAQVDLNELHAKATPH